jgi:hypothetical protein
MDHPWKCRVPAGASGFVTRMILSTENKDTAIENLNEDRLSTRTVGFGGVKNSVIGN